MEKILQELVTRYPVLESSLPDIRRAGEMLCGTFDAGNTLFVCGNGGSGADAEHIAGELLKSFVLDRPVTPLQRAALAEYGEDGAYLIQSLERGLPCISLLSHPGYATAFGNDVEPKLVFAQQLFALGRKGDLLMGLSTSGNAENIRQAMIVAKISGIRSILLTGAGNGKCAGYADLTVHVPETETFKVQELHLPVYHALCMIAEKHAFGGE
ncbi:MAG: SIS domain-containing protein [Lentisphaeria bacterium]|nr:SIS domain-containing protein [Lentisphaeria bacterium]